MTCKEQFMFLSVSLFIHQDLSVSLSIYLCVSIDLSASLSVHLYVSIYLLMSLYVCVFLQRRAAINGESERLPNRDVLQSTSALPILVCPREVGTVILNFPLVKNHSEKFVEGKELSLVLHVDSQ